MMLLGSGCAPGSETEVVKKARQYIIDAPKSILGKSIHEVNIIPNGIEDFHNVEKIYGDSYQKLQQVKTKVDPKDRLKGWITPLVV